jgi:hypothetical protein
MMIHYNAVAADVVVDGAVVAVVVVAVVTCVVVFRKAHCHT